MNPRTWLEEHDTENYVGPMAREAKEDYLEQAAAVMHDEEALRAVNGARLERVLHWLSLTLGSCIRSEVIPSAVRIRAIDSIPSLFRWLAASGPHSPDGPVFMFWEGVIPSRPRKLPQDVRDAIFAALACQIFLGNETVRAGAAHGFNHLKDKRCLPLLEHAARTTADADLANYVRAAMAFDQM